MVPFYLDVGLVVFTYDLNITDFSTDQTNVIGAVLLENRGKEGHVSILSSTEDLRL